LQIFHRRYANGSDWSTAEIRIQKVVDVMAMHYISFKGSYNTTIGSLVFGFQDTELMVFENDGNIGIGTSDPAESAALDISSNSRGFLPPRMNSSEIAYIQSPANGLTVFNVTDAHLYVYTQWDNQWKMMAYDATVITPFTCGNSFSDDRDGKSYQTIQIGSQCWMKENLNVGTRIDASTTQTNNAVIEKYCYSNSDANCTTQGGLYQWDEMMNYASSSSSNPSGIKGICPIGWHIPSDAEWCQMETYLDAGATCSTSGWRGTDVGGKMKQTGTTNWTSPNTGATNSSGFTGLGSGYASGGSFSNRNVYAYLWSATEYSSTDAWNRRLGYNTAQEGRFSGVKTGGFSVRCVKD
jgi:uncharacterized protein (TIGR02145 family)